MDLGDVRSGLLRLTAAVLPFDGIIDLFAPSLDPDDPGLWSEQCDSGDHVHPSAAGAVLIAEGIDLSLLLRD